ncbi:MAG TPA: pyridoxamine 5'-phosphate oxidase family protein [Acidimicrobiales bacterium]|nr:pyridoxamine 5'-phosphate oxidase family protein [Acidimicrobiales bacterium]
MIEEMSSAEISEFVAEQKVGRVGCYGEDEVYVVPVIFAWRDDCVYVYTTEGKKVQMMRANATVCFEVDEYLPDGSWRSVIAQGRYEELRGDEAARALTIISERFLPSSGAARDDDRGAGRVPVAFLIRLQDITGRKVERD